MDKQQSDSESSLSLDEVYQGFDMDNNLWTEVNSDGKPITVIGKDFENGIKRIHEFVDRVRTSDAPAYWITSRPSGRMEARRTRLASIPTSSFITPEFRQAYEVSEQVRIFLEAEDELRLLEEHSLSEPLRASWTQPGKRLADVANVFVKLIRKKARRKNFRRRFAVRNFGVQENFNRGKALINALFCRRFRLNVLRVDFNYKREHKPNLEQAKCDLDRMLNNSRSNEIFHSVLGYIWHLEWGFESGWHWHVMYFLDGSKTRADAYVAHQFCDYWNRVITEGRGRAHNCNRDKNRYRRLGIGMITHGNHIMRAVLLEDVLPRSTKLLVPESRKERRLSGLASFLSLIPELVESGDLHQLVHGGSWAPPHE